MSFLGSETQDPLLNEKVKLDYFPVSVKGKEKNSLFLNNRNLCLGSEGPLIKVIEQQNQRRTLSIYFEI